MRAEVTRSPAGTPSINGAQSILEAAILAVSMYMDPLASICFWRFFPGPLAVVMTIRESTPSINAAWAKNESQMPLGRSFSPS